MNIGINEGLVSVVVPVHNGERTIKRCVDSILNQNYRDIEIILVDDNSTDLTYDILQDLKNKHANIVCIKLTGGSKGVSYARNIGLRAAKGKYIGFVDADDFISENMYQVMVSKICSLDSDIVVCAYSFVYDNYQVVNPTKYLGSEYEAVFSSEAAILELMKMHNARFTGHVWDKLYKKEVIGDINFVEGIHCYEDTLFNVEVMIKAKRIDFFNDSLYSYYINSNSVTNSQYSDKIFSSIQALKKMENLDFIKKNRVLSMAIQSRIFKECIAQSYMSSASPKCEEYIEQFKKIVLDRIKAFGMPKLTFKEKVQILLLVYSKTLFKCIVQRKRKKYEMRNTNIIHE